MTTLYLVRHGQSTSNALRVYAGHADYALSELGLLQAKAAAKALAKRPISAVYASDLERARQTAEAAADALGLSVRTDPALRELYAGEWEDLPRREIPLRFPEGSRLWHEDPEHNPIPGGEAVPDLRRRMTSAIQEIAERHTGESVLIVSHSLALEIFLSGVAGKPFRHGDFRLLNTSITTVRFEDGCFTVEEIGNAEHLPEELIPKYAPDGMIAHT